MSGIRIPNGSQPVTPIGDILILFAEADHLKVISNLGVVIDLSNAVQRPGDTMTGSLIMLQTAGYGFIAKVAGTPGTGPFQVISNSDVDIWHMDYNGNMLAASSAYLRGYEEFQNTFGDVALRVVQPHFGGDFLSIAGTIISTAGSGSQAVSFIPDTAYRLNIQTDLNTYNTDPSTWVKAINQSNPGTAQCLRLSSDGGADLILGGADTGEIEIATSAKTFKDATGTTFGFGSSGQYGNYILVTPHGPGQTPFMSSVGDANTNFGISPSGTGEIHLNSQNIQLGVSGAVPSYLNAGGGHALELSNTGGFLVNYLQLKNSISTTATSFGVSPASGDTVVDLEIYSKGGHLRFLSDTYWDTGTSYGALVLDVSKNATWLAPGTANNVMTSDGTQWTSAAITFPTLGDLLTGAGITPFTDGAYSPVNSITIQSGIVTGVT